LRGVSIFSNKKQNKSLIFSKEKKNENIKDSTMRSKKEKHFYQALS